MLVVTQTADDAMFGWSCMNEKLGHAIKRSVIKSCDCVKG